MKAKWRSVWIREKKISSENPLLNPEADLYENNIKKEESEISKGNLERIYKSQEEMIKKIQMEIQEEQTKYEQNNLEIDHIEKIILQSLKVHFEKIYI